MKETRTRIEVLVYVLILNPMQENTEDGRALAASYDREALIKWYEGEKAPEGWTDIATSQFTGNPSVFHKTFKQGSSLEWYNPCHLLDGVDDWGHGIQEHWVVDDGKIETDLFFIYE